MQQLNYLVSKPIYAVRVLVPPIPIEYSFEMETDVHHLESVYRANGTAAAQAAFEARTAFRSSARPQAGLLTQRVRTRLGSASAQRKENYMFKFRFRFNAAARKEALGAVRKLALMGSPIAAVGGFILFKTTNDKLAILAGSLLNFVVCSFLAVYISGLEEKPPENSPSKVPSKASKDDDDSS